MSQREERKNRREEKKLDQERTEPMASSSDKPELAFEVRKDRETGNDTEVEVLQEQVNILGSKMEWMQESMVSMIKAVSDLKEHVSASPSSGTGCPHQSEPAAVGISTNPQVAPGTAVPKGAKVKPQEFDGKVSWSAYKAQFELISVNNEWGDAEKAAHLAASLKGTALELLGYLSPETRGDYAALVVALEQRFGTANQDQLFRAQLRSRVRGAGESLAMLAQDVERLAHCAYPRAPEGFRATIICDQFIDALQDVDMQIAVRQGRPANIQQALASALEYESIKRAASAGSSFSARKTHVPPTGQNHLQEDMLQQILRRIEELEDHRTPASSSRLSSNNRGNRAASGPCWNCDQMGHLRRDCRKPKRAGPGWESRSSGSSPRNPRVRGLNVMDSVQVDGKINGKPCPMTIDSGANQTVIRKDILEIQNLPQAKQGLSDVTGRCSPLWGPLEVQLQIGDVQSTQCVFLSEQLSEHCILGLDYLSKHRCVLDAANMTLTIDGRVVPAFAGTPARLEHRCFKVQVRKSVTLPPNSETMVTCKSSGAVFDAPGMIEAGAGPVPGVMVARSLVDASKKSFQVLMANLTDTPKRIKPRAKVGVCEPVQVEGTQTERQASRQTDMPSHLQPLIDKCGGHLSPEQRVAVENLLLNYADVFSSGDKDLGCTLLAEHHIDTGSHRPVKTPPRRLPIPKRAEAEKAVQDMADQGLIERCTSPWSSALVLVRKKDCSLRCCVDYRNLNRLTTKDSYPLPRIDDSLDALAGAKWYSTLDLKSGYHQVPMAEEDKSKTAFSCGGGLWQFRVMPFGLCNAPATFERLMEAVLSGLHWNSLLVYLDDVIVFGQSFEQELERLREVFERFRRAQLKLNPKKCHLFQKEVQYLGHVVSPNGIQTDPDKCASVRDWPVPADKMQLRSFLGLCTYYRRFVRGFASIAAPLHNLTKEGQNFEWDSKCQTAFETLKIKLTSAPVLAYPNPEKQYILDTDASSCGIGAVLSQEVDGEEKVIAFFSRSLTRPERNYCVTRKELLAIVEAARHFHHYLYGSHFMIRTDHAALKWLRSIKDPEGQLARWLTRLDQYDFTVHYRPGAAHINADSMSRRPCQDDCNHCGRKEKVDHGRCLMAQTQTGPSRRGSSDPGATPALSVEPSPPVSNDLSGNEVAGEEVSAAQRADKELDVIITALENKTGRPAWDDVSSASRETKHYWTQWDLLKVRGGVLQRRWESVNGSTERWLTVIPRSLRSLMLQESHDAVTGGHFGIKKTLQRLRQRFYWVGMRHDVTEWCKACSVCCAKKGPRQKIQAPLQLYQVGAPMERVAVDIMGPLPVTTSGNRYILVAMDYFTKWPEAYAIPNQEATTVARKLVNEFFSRFGTPNELHSDQGRNFESAVFQECCSLMGIRKTRTTALHPESDGMVERFNATLGQQLAKFCRDNQATWDEKLPLLLMAYRSAEHEATEYTPARLMCGRELRLPIDVTTGCPPTDAVSSPTLPQFVCEMRQNLASVHQHVRENLKIAAGAMKLRHDAKASQEVLSPGDKVWLYNPKRKKGMCPKLSSDWEGPFTIINRLSDVIYRIKGERRSKPKVVHFNRLWRMHKAATFTWSQSPAVSEEEDAEDHASSEVSSENNVPEPDLAPRAAVDDLTQREPASGIQNTSAMDNEQHLEDTATSARGPSSCGSAVGQVDASDSSMSPMMTGDADGDVAVSATSPIRSRAHSTRARRAPAWLADFVLDV